MMLYESSRRAKIHSYTHSKDTIEYEKLTGPADLVLYTYLSSFNYI